MSDYIRVYNFTVKDSLPTGDSGKVIKGTEIDVELNAVASAIASKANINTPTFTGVPAAPTASAGTNTTQLATTAFVHAERTNTATLTNKTLTSPTINSPTVTALSLTDSSIVFEGSTADAFETTLTVTNPTADRTVTIPDATTTLVGTDTTQTLTNKTISGGTFSGTIAGTPTFSGNLAFSGAPTSTTPATSDNSTKIATTAYVKAALQLMYPVGSVYINASVTTNPNTLLGFGTWAAIGAGRVLVGQDTADVDFDVLGETGGSKSSVASHTHTFTTGTESASHTHSGTTSAVSNDHTHSFSGTGTAASNGAHTHTITDPGHTHSVPSGGSVSSTIRYETSGTSFFNSQTTGSSTTGITIDSGGAHTHTVTVSGTTAGQSTGHTHTITTGNASVTHTHSGTTASTGTANGNLQPYVVVKMWQRTA